MKGSLFITFDELTFDDAQHYDPLLSIGIAAPDVRHIRIGGVEIEIEQLEREAQTPLASGEIQKVRDWNDCCPTPVRAEATRRVQGSTNSYERVRQ